MKKIGIIISLGFVFLLSNCQVSAQKEREVNKSFAAKETIKISTVSGNCIVKKSDINQITIKLVYTYPDDCFKYKIDESSDYIEVKEEFDGNCNGNSNWTISVPENTEVSFNSASGDFLINGTIKGVNGNTASGNIKLENIGGEVKLNTASGDIMLSSMNGNLDLNTASGNIKMESVSGKSKLTTASGDIIGKNVTGEMKISVASGNVNIQSSKSNIDANSASGDIVLANIIGALKLNTASGNVEADQVEIASESSFNTASGDVKVKLAKSAEYDLTLSTASGNVGLDYNGNEMKGYFEFTARYEKGEIVSAVKFDKEEVVEIEGKKYDKKSFTKGSSSPKITLKTSSGTIRFGK